MDISEVAKLSKLPGSTLRYYEERGLIQPVGRKGLRRYYAESVLQRLAVITLGRNVGLSINEINKMLLPGGIEVDRDLLRSKADELDKKIAEMSSIRDGLRHAAECPAKRHMECPRFLKILRLTSKIGRKGT